MADTVEYGLSSEGFKRKRLPEIIESLNSRVADKLGISIQTGSNSIFGQLHGIYAYEIADLWEVLEDVYNAMYPHTASGVSLTNAAALVAITPIAATYTTIVCACTGEDGTTIPANSQIQDSSSNTYSISTDAVISKGNASVVNLNLTNVVSGTVYSLAIDDETAKYTASDTDTVNSVLVGLKNNFTRDDITITITNENMNIAMNDNTETMNITVSNLTVVEVTSPITFTCDVTGEINPTLGNVTNINTAVTGWNSVSNIKNNVGRNNETDTELRQRWSISVYNRASNMVDAIQANILQNVSDVLACRVYENISDSVDEDGRLPHSIEVVVDGGADEEIAEIIYKYKVAGIDTNGTESVDVADSQGLTHTIKFNRPTLVPVWLKIEIDKNAEESWGNNSPNEIKNLILAQIEDMTIGDNVILQKFIGTIYSNINGIAYITITATTGETAGTYTNSNIEIGDHEKASFDSNRIEVVINE